MAVWNRLTGAVLGVGIGGAARDALAPSLEVAKQTAWGQRAIRVLDVAQAAAASVRGIDFGVDYADDAKREGVGANRFRTLEELARTRPGLPDLLELWRRREIGPDLVFAALRRQGYSETWAGHLQQLRDVLPTVTDMVRFAVRETYTPEIADTFGQYDDFPEAFADDAEKVGLPRDRARQYWAAHWDLPSPEQGFELYHRNVIDRPTLEKLLRALDVMPYWRGRLIRLAERIPPLTDMIRFAVREVYDPAGRRELGLDSDYPAAFTAEAALHGMDEERARQYWAAHWRLPSATQGFEMLHRREIDAGELDGLLKALDYPKLWRDRLRDIAYRVPGRIDLRRMLGTGVLTREQVKDGYLDLGYTPLWAERLTVFAERLVTEKTRDLTAAQLAAAFEGYQLTRAGLVSELRKIGYSAEEAESYAALGDARRVKKYSDAVMGKAHAQYLGGFITEAQAADALGQLQLARKSITDLLRLWNLEREINVTKLTAREIRAAYRRGAVSLESAIAQLRARGYSTDDAETFIGLEAPRLNASQIVAAVDRHAITEAEGLRQLEALGYTIADAQALLSAQIEELSSRQIVDAVGEGTISREEGVQRLLALGYRPADAAVLLPATP